VWHYIEEMETMDHKKEVHRKWMEAHRDDVAKYRRQWILQNKEKVAAAQKRWLDKNRDKYNAYYRDKYHHSKSIGDPTDANAD